MNIIVDDLSGPEIHKLLQEHLQNMRLHSPPESVHALDLDALRQPEITFWTVWKNRELLGCGALKEIDSRHAEVKSMRTSSAHLRKGVAAKLLNHIMEEARRRAYGRLSLETGSMEAFEPARLLYASFGFTYCEPFADYVENPNSVFMTRKLQGLLPFGDNSSDKSINLSSKVITSRDVTHHSHKFLPSTESRRQS